MVEDGGAAHTINLCKSYDNEMRMKRGERKVTAARRTEMIEEKAFRGERWVTYGLEQLVRRMWKHFSIRKAWARSVLVVAERERQEGREGIWQQESPFKEELELVKHSRNLRCEGLLIRPAYYARKSGVWESYLEELVKDDKLRVRASIKVRECCNEVEAEDEDRLSIA